MEKFQRDLLNTINTSVSAGGDLNGAVTGQGGSTVVTPPPTQNPVSPNPQAAKP
jgi:hypothetical protein